MTYQFVLQWPASSIEDYDAIVELEEALIGVLTAGSALDGHDAGSGEFNLFIRTDDPRRAFNEIRSVLGDHDAWLDVRVAYRGLAATKYTVIWPRELTEFKVG